MYLNNEHIANKKDPYKLKIMILIFMELMIMMFLIQMIRITFLLIIPIKNKETTMIRVHLLLYKIKKTILMMISFTIYQLIRLNK